MNPLRKAGIELVLLAVLSVGPARMSPAQAIISPRDNASTEGDIDNGYPFNIQPFGLPSMRYQQVYEASDFIALSGPASVTLISFRPDALTGQAFSSTLPDVQIDLSTTRTAADGLSTTFAANVGRDDTVVFTGPLPLSSVDTGPAGGPKDFDIDVALNRPFVYDPRAGSLLLDVRNFDGGQTTQFDASDVLGDSVSRVYSQDGGVGASTGFTDTLGLVTRFTFGKAPPPSSIPEPTPTATMGLGMLSLAGLALLSRRRIAPAKRKRF